jgi:hypothetical protein
VLRGHTPDHENSDRDDCQPEQNHRSPPDESDSADRPGRPNLLLHRGYSNTSIGPAMLEPKANRALPIPALKILVTLFS